MYMSVCVCMYVCIHIHSYMCTCDVYNEQERKTDNDIDRSIYKQTDTHNVTN